MLAAIRCAVNELIIKTRVRLCLSLVSGVEEMGLVQFIQRKKEGRSTKLLCTG